MSKLILFGLFLSFFQVFSIADEIENEQAAAAAEIAEEMKLVGENIPKENITEESIENKTEIAEEIPSSETIENEAEVENNAAKEEVTEKVSEEELEAQHAEEAELREANIMEE